VKKSPWDRVVTSDGYAPLLFYFMLGLGVVLAGFFLHFWLNFGARFVAW
jgi:hypothetical protein